VARTTPSVSTTASSHSPAHPKNPVTPFFTATSKTSQKSAFQRSLTPLFSIAPSHDFAFFLTLKEITPSFSITSEKHRGWGDAKFQKLFANWPRTARGLCSQIASFLTPLSSAVTENGWGVGQAFPALWFLSSETPNDKP